ncbi:MAG: thiamine phosphate synthase [Aliishimia sp.]
MTGRLGAQLRLYLITDAALCRRHGLIETVREAVTGGVTMVQLRDKTATTAQRVEMALALGDVLSGTGVPLVVNDDVDAALAAKADGVHIGQSDIDVQHARQMIGPDKILGLSCETQQHVRDADPKLVDYLGLGPVFETATKSDHAAAIGLKRLVDMVALSSVPTVAIGGLTAAHKDMVKASGANGLAVVSAICGQGDVLAAARAFGTNVQERAT